MAASCLCVFLVVTVLVSPTIAQQSPAQPDGLLEDFLLKNVDRYTRLPRSYYIPKGYFNKVPQEQRPQSAGEGAVDPQCGCDTPSCLCPEYVSRAVPPRGRPPYSFLKDVS